MSLFSKSDVHSVLLIDITSSSVGIGLSGMKDDALPELVFSARIPFGFKEDFDTAHIEHAMMHALKDLLSISLHEGAKLLKDRGFSSTINHAVISFSSPWHASSVSSDVNGFKKDLEKRFDGRVEIFESEMGHTSAAERRLIKKIEDEVIRTFGIKKGMDISSFNFTFSRVVNQTLHDIHPAVFVDMTGRATDVLKMNKNSYQGSFSLPVGSHHLGRAEDISWEEYWSIINDEHMPEFHKGNLFLVADDYELGKKYLHRVLPFSRIIPFGTNKGFLNDLVKFQKGTSSTERIAILAAYSKLFI